MKQRIELKPVIKRDDILIEFSDRVELNKDVLASIPSEFFGILYIDEKPMVRLEACNKVSLLKYVGKEFKNKNIKFAFVRKTDLPYIPWGFGDINVKNERLSETYRVGANGKYLLKVKDASLVIKAFGSDRNISMELIADKTKEIIKTIGKPILSKYFSDTNVSVFEINSKIDEIREAMVAKIKAENAFAEMGLELKILTLDSIHVNDEDMELIRNRINENVAKNDSLQTYNVEESPKDSFYDSFNVSLMDEIQDLKDQIAKISENQEMDAVLDEIDNLHAEMSDALKNAHSTGNETIVNELSLELNDLKKQIAQFGQSNDDSKSQLKATKMIEQLDKKMTDKLDSSLKEIRSIVENAQNRSPSNEKAKEGVETLKSTTDFLLGKAELDDDYSIIAGPISSNVEENLINKFNVPHKGKDFYMPKEEFDELSKTLMCAGEPIFKDSFKCKYLKYPKMVGTYVEMPPEIRFIKAGLSVEEACKAAKDWVLINKLKHRSEENDRYIEKTLAAMKMTKKEFLLHVIDTFRKFGLYTRD